MNIFKYEVLPGTNRVNLPQSSKVLSAGIQGDSIFIWALVDNSNDMQDIEIFVTGTGHNIDDNLARQLKFIDTVFAGDFVWHVFERH